MKTFERVLSACRFIGLVAGVLVIVGLLLFLRLLIIVSL